MQKAGEIPDTIMAKKAQWVEWERIEWVNSSMDNDKERN